MDNSRLLSARGIGKTVKSGDSDLVILRDIDLEVTRGEALAVLGASGSGKSTLLAILAGLDTPTAGTVELEGADLFALDEDQRAEMRGRAVGFVFQSFQLLPALTALENVMLPLELAGKDDAEDLARRMLERVGLGERLHHYPKHLSGGEQQRVALARAFVVRPKLLLADEPLAGLGAQEIDRLLATMGALAGSGLTIVIIEHTMKAMVRLADRLLVLDHGALLASGSPERVTADAKVIEAYLGKRWAARAAN